MQTGRRSPAQEFKTTAFKIESQFPLPVASLHNVLDPPSPERVKFFHQRGISPGTQSAYPVLGASPEVSPMTPRLFDSLVGALIRIGLLLALVIMLMAENARSRFVWDTFMKNREAQRGMQLAGFKPYKAS